MTLKITKRKRGRGEESDGEKKKRKRGRWKASDGKNKEDKSRKRERK